MQDFLDLKQGGGSSGSGGSADKGDKTTPTQGRKVERKVDLRVLLPDHSVITVPISEHWRSTEVFQVLFPQYYISKIFDVHTGAYVCTALVIPSYSLLWYLYLHSL